MSADTDPRDTSGDFTIIIPTLNCREALDAHVDSLSAWWDAAAEIIVVDSESTDGSLDFLRMRIQHRNVKFFSRPRGLYQAWNFAVSQAAGEFVYFATVGDRMGPDGAKRLAAAAHAWNADVILSPPRIVDSTGEPFSDVKWPIHRLIDLAGSSNPFLLGEWEKFALASCFGIQGILGSSASNWYRRNSLLACPFPEDFGHAGDSLWGRLFAFGRRVVVVPETLADFVVEDRDLKFGRLKDSEYVRQVLALEQATKNQLYASERSNPAMRLIQEGREMFAVWVNEKTHDLEHLKQTCSDQLAYIGDLKADGAARLELIERQASELQRLEEEVIRLRKEIQSRPPSLVQRAVRWFGGGQ